MSAPGAGDGARFGDRLALAAETVGAPACVGLDPALDRLPQALRPRESADPGAAAGAIETFCLHVLDAVAGAAGVVKPQSACFERFGSAGVRALERVCAEARSRGLLVILDVKRGDIGVTAEHYASAAFDAAGADAATVSAYMGADTLEPWLKHKPARAPADRGVFVLVRTSNPGSDWLQSAVVDGPVKEPVADRVARLVREIGAARAGESGWSSVGAVVAATKPADAARMRGLMPHTPFLVPGWGAQGGTAETVRPLLGRGASGGGAVFRGAIVNASRSVIFAFEPGAGDWRAKVRDAARRFADELRTL